MKSLSIDWIAHQLTPAPKGIGRNCVVCDLRSAFNKTTLAAARRRGYRVERTGQWTYIVYAKNQTEI